MKHLYRLLFLFFIVFQIGLLSNQSASAQVVMCSGDTFYTVKKGGESCRCPEHQNLVKEQSGKRWRCNYQAGGAGNSSIWIDITSSSGPGIGVTVPGCSAPFDIPDACPSPKDPNSSNTNYYVPNFECINRKLLDPSYSCCRNICAEKAGGIDIAAQPEVFQKLFSFFGRTIAITSGNQLIAIFNIAITTILGIFTVIALVFGVYIGAFVRARTTDQEEIANANRTLVNIIIGFTLAWSFLFIIQIVMGFLGLGNLSNLVFLENNPDDPNVIIIN